MKSHHFTALHKPGSPARVSRGMTLVELMVAMLLGLLLAGAALSTFLASTQLARSMRGAAAVSDTGQSFVGYISQQIRAAGHVDLMETNTSLKLINQLDQNIGPSSTGDGSLLGMVVSTQIPGLRSISGCNGPFSDPAALLNYACAADNPMAASLSLSYQILATPSGWLASSLPELFDPARGFQTDCGGRATRTASNPSANPAGDFVINRYYLDATNKRLMCIGNGDTSKPAQIASDVEQFQVLYATSQASGSNSSSIGKFVPAGDINAMVNGWSAVVALQVCVLAVGEPGSLANASGGTNVFNVDCAGNPAATSDGRLRRAHRTTINLRSGTRSATTIQ